LPSMLMPWARATHVLCPGGALRSTAWSVEGCCLWLAMASVPQDQIEACRLCPMCAPNITLDPNEKAKSLILLVCGISSAGRAAVRKALG